MPEGRVPSIAVERALAKLPRHLDARELDGSADTFVNVHHGERWTLKGSRPSCLLPSLTFALRHSPKPWALRRGRHLTAAEAARFQGITPERYQWPGGGDNMYGLLGNTMSGNVVGRLVVRLCKACHDRWDFQDPWSSGDAWRELCGSAAADLSAGEAHAAGSPVLLGPGAGPRSDASLAIRPRPDASSGAPLGYSGAPPGPPGPSLGARPGDHERPPCPAGLGRATRSRSAAAGGASSDSAGVGPAHGLPAGLGRLVGRTAGKHGGSRAHSYGAPVRDDLPEVIPFCSDPRVRREAKRGWAEASRESQTNRSSATYGGLTCGSATPANRGDGRRRLSLVAEALGAGPPPVMGPGPALLCLSGQAHGLGAAEGLAHSAGPSGSTHASGPPGGARPKRRVQRRA